MTEINLMIDISLLTQICVLQSWEIFKEIIEQLKAKESFVFFL